MQARHAVEDLRRVMAPLGADREGRHAPRQQLPAKRIAVGPRRLHHHFDAWSSAAELLEQVHKLPRLDRMGELEMLDHLAV